MKDSARYVKRVEWSDEDGCFVGSCPRVIGPCCHGDDEVAVYRELCGIVDEWLEVIRDEEEALPERTANRRWSGGVADGHAVQAGKAAGNPHTERGGG